MWLKLLNYRKYSELVLLLITIYLLFVLLQVSGSLFFPDNRTKTRNTTHCIFAGYYYVTVNVTSDLLDIKCHILISYKLFCHGQKCVL